LFAQHLRLPLAFGLAVLVGLAATGCSEARKQRHLERGVKFAEAGKHNEAIIELRNAIQIDPDFAPARHALGRSYRAKSWPAWAQLEFQLALKVTPDLLPARMDLGRVSVELEAWDDALEQGQAIRAKELDNPVGLYLVAAALNGKGKPKEALEILAEVKGDAMPTPELETTRAGALAGLDRFAEAEKAYRGVLARDPKAIDALIGLGRLLFHQGKREEALAALGQAKATEPGNPKVHLALSAAQATLGRLDAAITELEQLPRPARSARVVLSLARLYVKTGRFGDAIELLSPLLPHFSEATPAQYLLGHALLGSDRPEQAIIAFQEVLNRSPDNAFARYGLGSAHLLAGRPQEALRHLEPLRKDLGRVPDYHLQIARAYMTLSRWDEALGAGRQAARLAPGSVEPWDLLGAVALRRGDLRTAEKMYAKALEVDSSSLQARVALGRVYDLDRKPEEALREYETALKADPRYGPAVIAKVSTLVGQKRVDDAIDFVRSALKDDPGNARLIATLGDLYWLKDDRRKAAEEFRRALIVDDRFIAARFNLARLALVEGREEEAIEHLQRILKDRPGHVPAVVLFTVLHNRQGRYDRSISVVAAAGQANPHAQDLVLYLADLYVKAGRHDDAIAAVGPVLDANPNLVQARIAAGLAHLGKRNAAEAVKQFERVREINPKLALNHYYLARAHVAGGDRAAAQRSYKAALALDPNLKAARLELAAVGGQTPEAQVLAARVDELERAVQQDLADASHRYALAQALLASRQTARAEAELKRVLDMAPSFAAASYSLALIRLNERRDDEAAEHLKTALRSSPSHVDANVLLAAHLERKGLRERAANHLETVLQANSGLHDVKLRLANLYGQIGRAEDGIAKAADVIASRPRSAEAHLVLGNLYLRQGDVARGIESLKRAIQLKPNLVDAHFGLALTYQQRGEFDRAAAGYRIVIGLDPKSPGAYNNLAWIYAERGWNLDEALSLARRAAELAPNSAPFLDTLGWVHYTRGEYAVAGPILNKAAALAPSSSTSQYHLGMVSSRLGRKDVAVAALRQTLLLDPQFPDAPKIRETLEALGQRQ
jgi:tetratricopeptide (TPR) repeat protein